MSDEATYRKLCYSCGLSGLTNNPCCPKSWTESARASRSTPGDAAGCWDVKVPQEPTRVGIVEAARERLRQGEAPEDVQQWLAGQYSEQMAEERLRARYERGCSLPGRTDDGAKRVDPAGEFPDMARAAAAGVVNAFALCPTRMSNCVGCRAPRCAGKAGERALADGEAA